MYVTRGKKENGRYNHYFLYLKIVSPNFNLMQFNFLVILLAALVPLILGFIYYHPAVMGKMWMVVNGFKEDDLKVGNMFVIFITTFIFSFLLLSLIHI